MKKINLLTSLALLGIAFIILSCHYHGTTFLGLTGEDTIDLSGAVVSPTVEATYTSTAADSIALNSTTLGPLTLPVTNMNTLYVQAKKLLGTGGPGYITALFIYYGVNSTTMKMTYYFRPVCLQATPAPSAAGTYTYYPTAASLSGNNPFYTINAAGTFTTDVTNQINQDTSSYKADISIIHYTSDPYPHYMNFSTYANSIEDGIYVVFPFQEILQYKADNAIPSTGNFVLYNTCVRVIGNGMSYARHDMSLGNPSGSAGGMFCGNYADMGHMVPPDQQNLSYTITSIGVMTAVAR